MKIAIYSDNNKLKPLIERLRNEKYYVETNPKRLNENVLVISDKNISEYKSVIRNFNHFYIGDGPYARALEKDIYNKTILTMQGLYTEEEPTTYISCWFNGLDFILPAVLSVSSDRFGEHGKGVLTSSMGCVLTVLKSKSKAFKSVLSPFKETLRRTDYKGFFTLACVIKEDSIKVSKILPYFKYDLFYAFFAGVEEELGTAFHNIAVGKKDSFHFPENCAIAISISIPPFPYEQLNKQFSTRYLLEGFCAENEKHIWLQNTVRDENGKVISNGLNGKVATVTARGTTVRECRRRAYRTVQNISIENMQYREDIGETARMIFEELQTWGWL